MNEIAIVGL